jgi:hypothetical protein
MSTATIISPMIMPPNSLRPLLYHLEAVGCRRIQSHAEAAGRRIQRPASMQVTILLPRTRKRPQTMFAPAFHVTANKTRGTSP